MNSYIDFSSAKDKIEKLHDALKIAKRALAKRSEHGNREYDSLIKQTKFEEMSDSGIENWFKSSKSDIDEIAILYYWTVFEQTIIEYLKNNCTITDDLSLDQFKLNLEKKLDSEISRWRFSEILDLFKPDIDKDIIGQAKAIKGYRDFIVHRSKEKPKVTPKQAELILLSILKKSQ